MQRASEEGEQDQPDRANAGKLDACWKTRYACSISSRRYCLPSTCGESLLLTFPCSSESPEGIDRKFTLNFYSRMRFIHNLLPLLRNATASEPHFARTLSVLSAGTEGAINLDDLELKNTYSGPRCANHTIVMNDFMTGEFASRNPEISFVHSFPGAVNTGLTRELPWWLRAPLKALTPLFSLLLMVPAHETGQRQLFIATNGIYPPARPVQGTKFASGVPAPAGVATLPGVDKNVGSGGYLVSWNCEPTGKKILDEYREKGVSKIVWEHTMGIFDRVEKINKGRDLSGNA